MGAFKSPGARPTDENLAGRLNLSCNTERGLSNNLRGKYVSTAQPGSGNREAMTLGDVKREWGFALRLPDQGDAERAYSGHEHQFSLRQL